MSDQERILIENTLNYITEAMLEKYSKNHNISFNNALNLFTKSKTYVALHDFDTLIYREGPDYLLELFERELKQK